MVLLLDKLMVRNIMIDSAVSGFRNIIFTLRVSFFMSSAVNRLRNDIPSEIDVTQFAFVDGSSG